MAKNYYASPSNGNAIGGKRWDDGTFSGVKKITVTTTDKTLTSLQVTYALEGHDPTVRMKDFGGLIHGEVVTDKKEFIVDYPREYITKISGYMGSVQPPNNCGKCQCQHLNNCDKCQCYYVVKSLTFHTNKRTLGPCGPPDGTPFETPVDGVIVGFFGTSAALLDSLGAYMLVD